MGSSRVILFIVYRIRTMQDRKSPRNDGLTKVLPTFVVCNKRSIGEFY